MAVSVTGPRVVNELGGPVIPGMFNNEQLQKFVEMFIIGLQIMEGFEIS